MSQAITLRLLGSPAIEVDGAVLTGRAAQRRRVALLALLAFAPARTLTRERIMALLWPESDTQQARHLLTVAIHEVRKVLGVDVVLTRGDDVELNAARVSCDVEAFESACESGDLAHALSLYPGPLLDGFHINDAPDFERWADAERSRIAQRFATALESHARNLAGSGDSLAAVEVWRRLATLEPYNSRIARELMLALGAAGDRAGALQLARVHTLLLQEEYGAQPDAEFVALADRLRTGPGTPVAATPLAARAEDVAAVIHDHALSTLPEVTTAPARVTPVQPSRAVRLRRSRAARVASSVLVIGIVALAGWLLLPPRAPASESPVGIAVLPFRNLESAPEHGLFGAGLGEEISMALGRLEQLRVVGALSTSALRGDENVTEAGALLRVAYLVGGSIRTGGERMYVNAWLDDATNGLRVWSDRFERPLKMADKVAVQEEIARAVVKELQLKLPWTTARAPLVPVTTDNMDAYRMYLQGRDLFDRRTAEGLGASLRYFQDAVRLDPDYVLAYAAQAEVFTLLGAYDYGVIEPKQAFEQARAAARRALDLDPDLAQAHVALGSIAFNYDRDAVEAENAFRRALAANGGYAQAYHWYGLFLATRGRMQEARAAMQHAGELDPISMVMRTALARQSYLERNFVLAIQRYRAAIARDSTFVLARLGLALSLAGADSLNAAIAEVQDAERLVNGPQPVTRGLLGYLYGRTGRHEIARGQLSALQSMSEKQYVPPEYFTLIHIGLGDHDSAFESLERGLEIRSSGSAYLAIEPIVDPLRNDPRFPPLLRKADPKTPQ